MKKRRGDMHYMNRYGMLGNLYRVQRFCMAPSGHKFFTKKISTHLLTVLTMRVILHTEQRKWIIKITRILINKVRSPLKGDMTYVKTKYFYRQFTG